MINVLFTLITVAAANPLSLYWHNRAGVNALQKKDHLGAYRAFTRALADNPLEMVTQLNLATTFELNEEYEKAEQTYAGVLAVLPPDHPQRFEVQFNLANVLAKQKKIDRALKAYQDALEIRPDSIEVKTNVEMMFAGGEGDGQGESQSESKDDKKKDQDDKKKDKRDNQQKREDALKDPPEKKDGKDQKKPKPFQDGKDLNAEDVKRILDEIKNQEQSIRAEEYEKNPKEGARGGKDW